MLGKFIGKAKRKIRRGYIKYVCPLKDNYTLTEARLDEKYRHYYEKKYRRFIEQLPKYKNTHKYSNKVWWCWLQGEEQAPELCKACLASLRKNLKNRDITVITKDNYSDYVEIPSFVLDKYRKGYITHTQFSDILRLELLIKYGGTWIDSSVLATGYDGSFFDKDLFVYKCFLKDGSGTVSSSWFITSEIDNPILHTTRDLLYHYLRQNSYFDRYFMLHIFFAIATERYPKEWESVPMIPNTIPHILQFEMDVPYCEERFNDVCKLSPIHKLTQKANLDSLPSNSVYKHIINNYLGRQTKK